MDKNNSLLENFKNIQELIRFTDQKAGMILIIYGFLVTIFLELNKNSHIVSPFSLGTKMILISILGSAFLCLMLIQVFFIIFKIIVPRKANKYKNSEVCYFYYEHITTIDKNVFLKEIEEQTEKKVTYDLASQIFEVAKILKLKNDYLRKTLYCLFASITILVMYIILIKI